MTTAFGVSRLIEIIDSEIRIIAALESSKLNMTGIL
jgi:hypothetical protein